MCSILDTNLKHLRDKSYLLLIKFQQLLKKFGKKNLKKK